MRKAFTYFTLCIAATVVFTSCNSTAYVPTPHRAPLLQEAEEVSLASSATLYSQSLSADFQLAASPIEHLGILARANFVEPQVGTNTFDSTTFYTGLSGRLFEGGIGYYQMIGEYFSFETYGGYGQMNDGRATLNSTGTSFVNFTMNRYFLQTAIGYRGKVFEFAPSLRVSLLRYNNIRFDRNDDNDFFFNGLNVNEGVNYLMFEPSFMFGLGYKYLKFQLSMGVSTNFNDIGFGYDPIALSAGIVLDLKPSYGNFFGSDEE